MILYATIDTSIFGRTYRQGELVDDTGWERSQYLQMFSLGMVTTATGTRIYNGPEKVEQTPSAPAVTTNPGGYEVTWDGLNDDLTTTRPVDWCWVEIHSSLTAGFTYSPDTLRGTLVAAGSQVCMAGDGYEVGVSDTYEILLIHRTSSGTASDPSTRVRVTVPPLVDTTAIEAMLAPLAGLPAEMAANSAAVASAMTDIGTLGDTVSTNATTAALAAADAMTAANGKNKIVFSASAAPTTGLGAYVAGDTWFQRTAGIVVGQWSFVSGAFSPVTIDSAVIANLNAAKIVAGTITADKMHADSILATSIKAGEVIAGKLAADSVVAANIKAGEVIAGKLSVDAVIAANIQALAVTAGKVAANAITATEIAAGSITAGKLDADSLTGRLISGATLVGGTIQTVPGFGQQQVIIDNAGIRLESAPGVSTTTLSTDPSQMSSFDGQINAQGLTVEGNMLINGLTNNFGAGSVTNLQKEINNSGLAPSATTGWMTYTFDDFLQTYRAGGCYDAASDQYHYGVDFFGKHLTSLHPDGSGGINAPLGVDGAPGDLSNGLTKMPGGGDYYTLGTKGGTAMYIERFSGTAPYAKISEVLWSNTDVPAAAIGNDGTNLITAWKEGNYFYIRTINPTTYAQVAQLGQNFLTAAQSWASVPCNKLCSVMYGNFDFGSPRFVVTSGDANGSAYSFLPTSSTTIAVQTTEQFPLATEPMSAMFWNPTSGNFVAVSKTQPHLVLHSKITWTSQSSLWWASSSYYQSANSYETTQGPRVSFTMGRRSHLWVTSPAIPSTGNAAVDPDSAKCFVGRGAADPTAAGMFNNQGNPTTGMVTHYWSTDPFTGTSHPITPNTFPLTAPALIQSAAVRPATTTPMWTLRGDGTVDVQDIAVNGVIKGQKNITSIGSTVSGAFNSAYPVRTLYVHTASTLDASALYTVALPNTCILSMSAAVETPGTTQLNPYSSQCTSTQVCWQGRTFLTTATTKPNTTFTASFRVDYQNGP